MAGLTYAWAGDFLERYRGALLDRDGDAFVALHRPDVEVQADPFRPALTGHNAIRARLLEGSETAEQVEFVFERHWLVAPTILAAWHASYVHGQTRARLRFAGFATFEIDGDGRIARARYWYNRAETPAG